MLSVQVNANNFLACGKKKIDIMKTKLTINMCTQIIHTICSKYKRVSKFILIVQNVNFPRKTNN